MGSHRLIHKSLKQRVLKVSSVLYQKHQVLLKLCFLMLPLLAMPKRFGCNISRLGFLGFQQAEILGLYG